MPVPRSTETTTPRTKVLSSNPDTVNGLNRVRFRRIRPALGLQRLMAQGACSSVWVAPTPRLRGAPQTGVGIVPFRTIAAVRTTFVWNVVTPSPIAPLVADANHVRSRHVPDLRTAQCQVRPGPTSAEVEPPLPIRPGPSRPRPPRSHPARQPPSGTVERTVQTR
jgi:hypothetical protein